MIMLSTFSISIISQIKIKNCSSKKYKIQIYLNLIKSLDLIYTTSFENSLNFFNNMK